MVLTNFECWANCSESSTSTSTSLLSRIPGDRNIIERRYNSVDLFNPNVVRNCNQMNNNLVIKQTLANATINSNNNNVNNCNDGNDQSNNRNVSHLSSNGYYGFAQICNTDINNDASSSPIQISTKKQNDEINETMMMDINPTITPMNLDDMSSSSSSSANATSLNIFSSSANSIIENPMVNYRNNFSERRKRYLTNDKDDDFYDLINRNAKRFRSCSQQQHFYENQGNNLSSMFDVTSSTTSTIYHHHPKTKMNNFNNIMEYDDIPNVFSSIQRNQTFQQQQQNHHQSLIESLPLVMNNNGNVGGASESCASFKSNFRSNKYKDISRCMTSHMI